MDFVLKYLNSLKSDKMDNVFIQKELFEKLFNSAPDPIIIADKQGVIMLVNTETEKKFGYVNSELIGKKIEDLMPERFRGSHVGHRTRYSESPSVRPMGAALDLYALRHDGSEFPVEISLSPMQIGDQCMVISIIRDITDRKKVQQELEKSNNELKRSNQELEQFAYVASHDLQEPLRSIAGSCQFLERKYKDNIDPLTQEFIGYAVDGAKRMQELINDLLSYSRVTTQAQEFSKVDCNKLMEQVLANLKTSAAENGATIEFSKLPTLHVDRSQLLQLLQNLIANAIKFKAQDAPKIEVSAKKERNFWQFAVKDNGIGIDPKYFDKIFVIFRRLHQREEYPGTGIGLATCKKIVERHGGRIWVESQPGKGAIFYFTISENI